MRAKPATQPRLKAVSVAEMREQPPSEDEIEALAGIVSDETIRKVRRIFDMETDA